MATQERTEAPLGTNYAKHQAKIDAGQLKELSGWWDAATECRKKWNGNAKAYAIQAEKDSVEYVRTKPGVRAHSWNTIRQYVGAIMNAQKAGFTLDQFDSIDDVRQEMRKPSGKKAEPLTAKQEIAKYLASMSASQLEYIIAQAQRELSKKRK
jgi:hypothetical protein